MCGSKRHTAQVGVVAAATQRGASKCDNVPAAAEASAQQQPLQTASENSLRTASNPTLFCVRVVENAASLSSFTTKVSLVAVVRAPR